VLLIKKPLHSNSRVPDGIKFLQYWAIDLQLKKKRENPLTPDLSAYIAQERPFGSFQFHVVNSVSWMPLYVDVFCKIISLSLIHQVLFKTFALH